MDPQPQTQSTDEKVPQLSYKKLHEKLQQLKVKRTGIERRKQVATVKQNAKNNHTKPKNALKSLTKNSLQQVLNKFGISDPKVENEIMAEILAGNIKTPTQIAECIARKLQSVYPNGGPTPNQQTKPKQIKSKLNKPESVITKGGDFIYDMNNTTLKIGTDVSGAANVTNLSNTSNVPSNSVKKVFKRPTSSLLNK